MRCALTQASAKATKESDSTTGQPAHPHPSLGHRPWTHTPRMDQP